MPLMKANRLQKLSSLTPGTGFCYYLMHYQVKEHLEHNNDFPAIDDKFVLGQEFYDEVEKDIEFLEKVVADTRKMVVIDGIKKKETYMGSNKVECHKITLQKLKYVKRFVAKDNPQRNQFLPNQKLPDDLQLFPKEYTNKHANDTWGMAEIMGIPIFCFYSSQRRLMQKLAKCLHNLQNTLAILCFPV
jgi:hypothetical protein